MDSRRKGGARFTRCLQWFSQTSPEAKGRRRQASPSNYHDHNPVWLLALVGVVWFDLALLTQHLDM